MPEQPPTDTRARILGTALELFAAQGYQRTSLRQIAERLGISKAAVLYHFPAKDGILATLVRPMLDDLEAVLVVAAELAEPDGRRWAVIEGMLDTFIAHRTALLMLRHDLSMLTRPGDDYQRFLDVAVRAYQIVAGPGAGLRDRVCASQAVAVLGDPLVLFPETPVDELREIVLAGARRLLSHRGPAGDGASGPAPDAGSPPGAGVTGASGPRRTVRTGRTGRPSVLDAERLAAAQRMYGSGTRSVAEIAAAMGVSRATLYRHLDRSDTGISET